MITDERVLGENFNSEEEYLTYLRHLAAYKFAEEHIPVNSFVLEIGCGSGYGANLLSKSAQKIIGLDVDESTINRVSNKYSSTNCTFKLYDGLKIPYEDGSFDAVISFQVIEHIKNDKDIIKEIRRVLKPGGMMIMTTPNRIFRFVEFGQKPSNKFHIREYSFLEFKKLLENEFSNIKISGIRGTDEVQKIEENNVIVSLKITSIDPLDLRRFLPEPLKHIIFKFIKKVSWKRQPESEKRSFLETYKLGDYYLIDSNIDKDAIDLIAVCRK